MILTDLLLDSPTTLLPPSIAVLEQPCAYTTKPTVPTWGFLPKHPCELYRSEHNKLNNNPGQILLYGTLNFQIPQRNTQARSFRSAGT